LPISISSDVSNARIILVFLICASPFGIFFEGPILDGVVAAVAAVGIAVVSRTIRPGEAEFLFSISRAAIAIAVVPASWIVIQVLPFKALAHPIWTSAEAAIGHPMIGAISIDIGASVMALGKYVSIVAIAFWAAAVAVDRQRAESILFSLLAASTLTALTVLIWKLFGLLHLGSATSAPVPAQAIDGVAVGVTIAAAAAVRTLERYETRYRGPGRTAAGLLRTFVVCMVALAICAVVVVAQGSVGVVVATACGVTALVLVVLSRRLGLGGWAIAAVVLLAAGIAASFVGRESGLRLRYLPLAFATEASTSQISMSQRILDDAPLMGTGAGTFSAIAPLYRDIDDLTMHFSPPTAAASVAVEFGQPVLWFIVVAIAASIVLLLRASLRRGRDYFYPAEGAGCLITLLLLFFMNSGTLGTVAVTIAAATLGLAVAQSGSRTIQQ
jgi:hypothetical protein